MTEQTNTTHEDGAVELVATAAIEPVSLAHDATHAKRDFAKHGVAAPMAFFPFAGWKNSFFGDLHAHGKDAVYFYTEQKVLMTRWF